MNERARKMCRYCLYEEKCDDSNKVLDIFQTEFDQDLVEKIRCYTQIKISPDDKIPPNICMKCIECIVKFDKFLDYCWTSQKVLCELYDIPHQIRNVTSDHSKSHLSDENAVDGASKINESLTNSCVDNKSESCTDNKTDDTVSGDFLDDIDSDGTSFNEEKQMEAKKERKVIPLQTNESASRLVEGNSYACGICSQEFDSFFEYHDHQETHNGQLVFSCTKCDQLFSERQQLVQHDVNHKVACQVCSKMVLPKSLLAHLKKHTDLHSCSECSLTHTSRASLEKHVKARHTSQKGLVCHICGKQNSCQASLSRHLASHSSARPYQCQYCNFSAKSRSILKVHTARKHTATQKSCESCGKTFKSETSLQQHKKRIHSAKKYFCHICQKAFIEKYSLDKHILRKHSKQSHRCSFCAKEFDTVKQMKEHMHVHKQGSVSCSNCGKKFFYKKYLEKHMVKCMPDFKDKLTRLQSTISLPSSSVQLENLQDFSN